MYSGSLFAERLSLMYHSIIFENKNGFHKNTWDDWHLIPTSKPFFNPPKTKEKYVELPGSDNVIDLCDAIKGYPVYENRVGKFEFLVDNGHSNFLDLYSEIEEWINGSKLKAILEDDPEFYYEGRFTLDEPKCDEHWNYITIRYNTKPYKCRRTTTTEDWLWDPFNFETGVIQQAFLKDIQVSVRTNISFTDKTLVGRQPVSPTFTVNSLDGNGIRVWLWNEELSINVERIFPDGTTTDREYILSKISPDNVLYMSFSGYGTISVDFRSGGL